MDIEYFLAVHDDAEFIDAFALERRHNFLKTGANDAVSVYPDDVTLNLKRFGLSDPHAAQFRLAAQF